MTHRQAGWWCLFLERFVEGADELGNQICFVKSAVDVGLNLRRKLRARNSDFRFISMYLVFEATKWVDHLEKMIQVEKRGGHVEKGKPVN